MNTEFSQFKHEAEKIHAIPPRSAWKRIEAQLDEHGTRRKMKISQYLNYAAAVLLVIGLGVLSIYLSKSNSVNQSKLYTLSLEDLSGEIDTESIYSVAKVNDLASYWGE